MSDVRLLDAHRISITNDEKTFQLLSLLHRNGPQSEAQICSLVDMTREELAQRRLQLFRAGLIEVLEDGRLGLKDRTELLLTRLGITTIAAKSLVPLESTNDWARTFLQACIEAGSDIDASMPLQYLYFLKTVDLLSTYPNKLIVLNIEEPFAQLSYDGIVGLDPDSRRLNGAQYVTRTIEWHRSRQSVLWQTSGNEWLDKIERINVLCSKAIRETEVCDRWLALAHDYSEKLSPTSRLAILTRVLKALLYEEPDPGLEFAFRCDNEFPYRVWKGIQTWEPEFRQLVLHLMEQSGSPLMTNFDMHETLEADLSEILKETLEKGNRYPAAQIRAYSRIEVSGQEAHTQQSGKATIDTALVLLKRLRTQLNHGIYDELSPDEKTNLCGQVSRLSAEFRTRFTPDT